MLHFVIADNQYITNSGLLYILEKNIVDLNTVEVKKKGELISKLELFPNSIVILDYTLFNFVSVNELIILQQKFENVKWILFSEELSEEFIKTILLNTTNISILLKDSSKEEINSCLKEVLNNKRYICNHVSNLLLNNNSNLIQKQFQKQILTFTEQEILKEISLGRTTKEIANNRFISVHTVMTHRKNIFRKIEVNNVHEATKFAIRTGLIDMTEYYI